MYLLGVDIYVDGVTVPCQSPLMITKCFAHKEYKARPLQLLLFSSLICRSKNIAKVSLRYWRNVQGEFNYTVGSDLFMNTCLIFFFIPESNYVRMVITNLPLRYSICINEAVL